MNDTSSTHTAADPGPAEGRGFEPRRIRTLMDMQRSSDDRMVAGVCGGVARYLDIDPVIVRVVIAAMTFVGLAGPILYLAVWFLVPADDAERSVAADWFNLRGEREEQVRTIGLIGAAAVAGLSIIGDSSWGWGPPAFGLLWIAIPAAILYWLFAVRPRRRREERGETAFAAAATLSATDGVPPSGTESTAIIPPQAPKPRRPRRSPALAFLTLSVVAVVLGGLGLWDAGHPSADITWLTYVATALGIMGLGLIVGAFMGHALWLTPLAIILAIALAIGTALPNGRIGEDHSRPISVAELQSTYTLGIGDFELDLQAFDEPDDLIGRSITVKQGVGSLRIIVPDGVDVRLRSHVRAGDIQVFDRHDSGTDRRLDLEGDPAKTLTLDTSLTLGQIQVIRP